MDELSLLTEEEIAELEAYSLRSRKEALQDLEKKFGLDLTDPKIDALIQEMKEQGYDLPAKRLNDADNPFLYDYFFGEAIRPEGDLGDKIMFEMSLEEAERRGLIDKSAPSLKDRDLGNMQRLPYYPSEDKGLSREDRMPYDPSKDKGGMLLLDAGDPFGFAVDNQAATGRDEFGNPLSAEQAAKQAALQAALGTRRPRRKAVDPDVAFVDAMIAASDPDKMTMYEMSRAPEMVGRPKRKVLPIDRESMLDVIGAGQEPSVGMSEQERVVDFLKQSLAESKDSEAFERARKSLEEYEGAPVRPGRSSFADETVDVKQDPLPADFDASVFYNDEVGDTFAAPDPERSEAERQRVDLQKIGMAQIRNAMAKARMDKMLEQPEITTEMIRDQLARGRGRKGLADMADRLEAKMTTPEGMRPGYKLVNKGAAQVPAAETKEVKIAKAAEEKASKELRSAEINRMADNLIEDTVNKRNQGQELLTLMPSINRFAESIRRASRRDPTVSNFDAAIRSARTPEQLNAVAAQARGAFQGSGQRGAMAGVADAVETAAATMTNHYKVQNALEADRRSVAANVFSAMDGDEMIDYKNRYSDYLADNPQVRTELGKAMKEMSDKIKATEIAAQKNGGGASEQMLEMLKLQKARLDVEGAQIRNKGYVKKQQREAKKAAEEAKKFSPAASRLYKSAVKDANQMLDILGRSTTYASYAKKPRLESKSFKRVLDKARSKLDNAQTDQQVEEATSLIQKLSYLFSDAFMTQPNMPTQGISEENAKKRLAQLETQLN